ncbi:hypothetical protein AV274_0103 [Blastocystis sp. ATCC 50177/Nand II]|uniref:Uncharacterized protein n=1 Tax=Blastocystis sp. subtype 1 (strain ATCC 50177 / NandII) TaxID=478820 RepID=A0A196SM83_BLAHN|nr:hypothetical protein AV274_0103 [Blastocystis sp. ATCC 50177/Nand II]
MSTVCPVGIDFGNVCTVMSAFQMNEKEPLKSTTLIVKDRNGSNCPSSEVFFDNGKRLTGEAAHIISDRNPSCCVRFIKSSIKRPYSQVNDDIRTAIESMREGDNGEVEYVVNVGGKEEHFLPSHLAGTYISDRIEDIKNDRKAERMNLVISIPAYYTEEQVTELQAGLKITGINDYLFITEPEAIAVEYGYYKNLNKEFDTQPLTVLFVGVGFAAAQVFAVTYTQDHFNILHYASSSEVSSGLVDSAFFQHIWEQYEEAKDEDSAPHEGNHDLYFRVLEKIQALKKQFCSEDMATAELGVNGGGDDEVWVDVDLDQVEAELAKKGVVEAFGAMVEACLEKLGDTKVDRIEVCDQGAFFWPFQRAASKAAAKHGLECELNTHRTTSECVARGNALYAFYTAYFSDARFAPVLSRLCDDVTPLCNFSSTADSSCVKQSEVKFSADMEARINAAVQLEANVSSQSQSAREKEDAQNEFQKRISDTLKKMDDAANWKEYALNRVMLEAMIGEAKKWFDETSRRADVEAAVFRARLAELEKQIEAEMARFHAEREIQLEKERVERERLERIRAAEEEKRRKEEEERRRVEREAMLKKWHALHDRLALLTSHLTKTEFEFLKQHEKEVVDVKPTAHGAHEGSLLRRLSSGRGSRGMEMDPRGMLGRGMEMDPRGMLGRGTEEGILPQTEEAMRAMAYCVPVAFGPSSAPRWDAPLPLRTKSVVEVEPGLLYDGDTLNGEPEGYGKMLNTQTREVVYEGQFSQGYFHGRGKLYHHNVQVKDGLFEKGLFKEGRYIRRDGRILIGKIVNGELEGTGKMILPSGVYIEGEWRNMKPHGKCKVHICKSIPDLTYDFDHPDDDTRFSVAVKPDRIFYNDNYYLSEGRFAHSNSPLFLFYFNGDVFIGNTTGRNEPVNGDFYRMTKDDYIKMAIGEKLDIVSVINLSCNPTLLVKNIDLEVSKDAEA